MATPNTLLKPAENTTNHNRGRTSAEPRRDGWRRKRLSSRPTTARRARSRCTGNEGRRVQRSGPGFACALLFIHAQGVEHFLRMQHTVERRGTDHAIHVAQEQRLAQLPIPGRETTGAGP